MHTFILVSALTLIKCSPWSKLVNFSRFELLQAIRGGVLSSARAIDGNEEEPTTLSFPFVVFHTKIVIVCRVPRHWQRNTKDAVDAVI